MRLPNWRGGGGERDAPLSDGDDSAGDDSGDGLGHKALPTFGIAGQNQAFWGRGPEVIEIT